MSRRTFLALCGAGAAGTAAGVWRLSDGADRDWRPRARRLVTGFDDPVAARAVGDAYLAWNPGERDGARLLAGLERSDRAWSRAARTEEVRRLAAAGSRRDYAAGRVVNARGWMLSLTEARLCGLATLLDAT